MNKLKAIKELAKEKSILYIAIAFSLLAYAAELIFFKSELEIILMFIFVSVIIILVMLCKLYRIEGVVDGYKSGLSDSFEAGFEKGYKSGFLASDGIYKNGIKAVKGSKLAA
jgi:hypothetical protein